MRIRDSIPAIDEPALPIGRIYVKHPAYPTPNTLLTFNAWDRPEGGLYTNTVQVACALVACNSFDGYISHDRAGNDRVNDTILSPGDYYFHVPSPSSWSDDDVSAHISSPQAASTDIYRYPIYPSFQHWKFPHDILPPMWQRPKHPQTATDELASRSMTLAFARSVSGVSNAVIVRDGACIVSGSPDYPDRAHLVPRQETEWFQKNDMARYSTSLQLVGVAETDDIANAVALRPDIHRCFDRNGFVFVPKEGKWVAHFLEHTADLGRLFHNRAVTSELTGSVAPEFLLARFAAAIFPAVERFVEKGGRLVKYRSATDEDHEVIAEIDKATSRILYGQAKGRGRSESPKKRKAGTDSVIDENDFRKRRCDDTDDPTHTDVDEIALMERSESSASSPSNPHQTSSCPADTYFITHKTTADLSLNFDSPPDTLEQETQRLRHLATEARKRQRVAEPALMCCDYNAAEVAYARGDVGPAENGGAFLCVLCLGAEYPAIVD